MITKLQQMIEYSVYYIILLQACVERDPKILEATTEL
jgi:hypothetical protein